MTDPYEQIFLAIATKNKLEKKLLTDTQVRMLHAAVLQARKGKSPTVRVVTAPPTPKTPDGKPAEPVPGYPIVGKLGTGGTSTVFLAEDKKNERPKVALKILKPQLSKNENAKKRFLREAELLTKYEHSNLLKGYAYGSSGPLTYLVLEYLEGETVLDVINRENGLEERVALAILVEAAKVLGYLHGRGILHRDIKPDNLFLTKDNRVVLCDLGFAVPIPSRAGGVADEIEGTTSGTVAYMSPEQARGLADLDPRSDIYSLGATLYHMVMGEVPFSGDDSYDVMAKQVLEALSSSDIKNRRISTHVHYFIERMMSKDKKLRYATPEELVEDVRTQIAGFDSLRDRYEVVAEEEPPKKPPPKARKKKTDRFTTARRRVTARKRADDRKKTRRTNR
ncbi:MAG: serine/threonine-protein kinase [Planctomycetota bacterium]|jgi:serine/threonine protein kinase